MILRALVSKLSRATVAGTLDVELSSVTDDSRLVAPGVLFIAVRGEGVDGHRFIPNALAAGAPVIMAETAPPAGLKEGVTWVHLGDTRAALAISASAFFSDPWSSMAMAGITGTNGKTTTAFLLHHVMKTAWHRAGLLGTVVIDDGETVETAHQTTPGSLMLEGLLGRMRDHGCRGVAMEVSSHGIDQQRIAHVGFDAAVFTNLTQDHLDYHGTMENYFAAKKSWFLALAADPLGKKPTAIINVDDIYGQELAEALSGKMPVARFGFGVHCEFRANNFRQNARGDRKSVV